MIFMNIVKSDCVCFYQPHITVCRIFCYVRLRKVCFPVIISPSARQYQLDRYDALSLKVRTMHNNFRMARRNETADSCLRR